MAKPTYYPNKDMSEQEAYMSRKYRAIKRKVPKARIDIPEARRRVWRVERHYHGNGIVTAYMYRPGSRDRCTAIAVPHCILNSKPISYTNPELVKKPVKAILGVNC